MSVSTTGTTIENYIDWMLRETAFKEYGEASLKFVICRGQVVKVEKQSLATEQIPLQKKS